MHQRQVLQRMQDPLNRCSRRSGNHFAESGRRGAVSGVRIGAQVECFEDLHLRPVKPLQRTLHAEPGAGPRREGAEVGDRRRDEVRPGVEECTQGIVAACLQLLAQAGATDPAKAKAITAPTATRESTATAAAVIIRARR